MYHVVLVAVIVAMSALWWGVVRSAPWVLSMILPRRLAFALGAGLFVIALFSAFAAAHALGDPKAMVGSLVPGYVGVWLMLATSASFRRSVEDDQLLQRIAFMIALLVGVIVASLYVKSPQILAVLEVALVACGLWLTLRFTRSRG